ncbi:unnamed protein product [Amaranthus hypochondriacus]
MESLIGEELDLNWVCCLLDGDSSPYCESFRCPSPLVNPFPTSISHSVSTQDSSAHLDENEENDRKRVRVALGTTSSLKACREKQRRDLVNTRFFELSEVLERGTTPKLDKVGILTDAIRTVKLLREETSSLTCQNTELKQKITDLKAEKTELRAEKRRLKSEKEETEKRIKALGSHSSLQLHPSSGPNSYAIPCQAVGGKLMPLVNYTNVPMWQFVPQAAFDISQDHVLHPPVA